jgi:hypothetical protein
MTMDGGPIKSQYIILKRTNQMLSPIVVFFIEYTPSEVAPENRDLYVLLSPGLSWATGLPRVICIVSPAMKLCVFSYRNLVELTWTLAELYIDG